MCNTRENRCRKSATPVVAPGPALRLAIKQRQGVERPAKRLLRSQAQPALQDGGIDAAEVHRDLEVVIDQIGEARVDPEQPRPDMGAGQEDRAGRPVVGPLRSVLRNSPAELAEGQHQDSVSQPRRGQVVEERPERRRELLQQGGVVRELVRVGVIASLLEVIDARPQSGLDQPRGQLQPMRETPTRDKPHRRGRRRGH